MSTDVRATRVGSEAPTRAPLVDCDVHVYATADLAAPMEYLPREWRSRFEAKGISNGNVLLSPRFGHPTNAAMRSDAIPPEGGMPGSSLAFLREDHLDRHGIDHALLNALQPASFAAALAGPDEANVLCSAFNDYFLEQWVAEDDRLSYVLCVSPQDPEAAAAEVRRVGARNGVVGVFLPPANLLPGNRVLHPVYAAAEELQLPIYMHVTGTDFVYQGAPIPSGGFPESYCERRMAFSQLGEAYLASLMFTGTLQRFPTLRFVFAEFGFAWALPHVWRMDTMWKAIRVEVPWVKEWPSEYVSRQIRFTTQPLDEPRTAGDLERLIEMLGAEVLLFSTDYPHWDGDSPEHVLRTLDDETRRAIFSANALDCFPRLQG